MLCPECGHELVRTKSPMVEECKGESFRIEGIERLECPKCGEYVISAEQSDLLEDGLQEAYREKHGLLSPAEIVQIREANGWTQKEFERILGVTSPTVCRWETGRVIQSKPLDNLMRGIRDYARFADDLADRADTPRHVAVA